MKITDLSIKDLYNKFKLTSDSSTKVKLGLTYTKAIEKAFKESTPVIFHPDLEYIISSSRGLQLFNEFVDNYGLPISEFNRIRSLLEHRKRISDQSKAVAKDSKKQIVFEEYCDTISKLDSFKKKWEPAFMMFEFYKPKFDKCNYSKIYYEYAISKKPNSTKLLSRYGLGIVPDLVIFNHNYLKNNMILESIMNSSIFFDQTANQWLFESIKDNYSEGSDLYNCLTELSYNTALKDLWIRERTSFFESALTLDFENEVQFSKEDIEIVQKYITFKENSLKLTSDQDQINKIHSEIEKARSLKAKLEDSGPIIYDYLAYPVKENIFDQSADKKPGNLPDYIKKNYDTDYDGDEVKKDEPEEEPEADNSNNGMDAYKRTPESEPTPAPATVSEPKAKPVDDQGRQVNYYYYNYNNSFNRHHDNSLKYSKDDNSLRYSSANKTDNSINYADNSRNGSVEYSDSKQTGNVQHHVGSHNQATRTTTDNSSGKDFSTQYQKSLDLDKSQNKTQTAELKDINYDQSQNKTQNPEFKDINYNKDESLNKTQTADLKDINYKTNEKDDKSKSEDKAKTDEAKALIKKDVKDVKKPDNKDNKEKKESCNTFALDNTCFF